MVERPNRKHPRLSCYDYDEGGMYFLTICTKNKEKLLCRIVGRDVLDAPSILLTEKGKIVEKYIHSINNAENVSVEHYVIMPNHIHLLIYVDNPLGASGTSRPTHAALPRTVSGFKRLCNKEIGENIWQDSYYDRIIRGHKDFENHWNYIDKNPYLWLLGKDEI